MFVVALGLHELCFLVLGLVRADAVGNKGDRISVGGAKSILRESHGELGIGNLETELERRLAGMEDRNVQYLNELEDRNIERIEVVEERIDYTERMLARRSEVYTAEEKPFRGLPMVTPI